MIDNRWYDDLGDEWWSRDGRTGILHDIHPALFNYFKSVLGDLEGAKILDLGCGGGLLSEPFAARGAVVTGADLSRPSLVAAVRHARLSSLAINYVNANGQWLPFPDSSFDSVLTADFLEHVPDLDAVVGECARVLKAGGLFLYDTVNRTLRSRLIAIWLFERVLGVIPKNTHTARMLIKPAELHKIMARHGLVNCETRGLVPERGAARAFLSLLKEGRAGSFTIGSDTAISYVGYGRKV